LEHQAVHKTKAYSAASAKSPLASATIPRRDPNDRDVKIEILFCGICHSDLHCARDEWHEVMRTVYPCVPGHEIVGRVTKAIQKINEAYERMARSDVKHRFAIDMAFLRSE
jgi:D-arabinose 1-dehydrogenase-like Zn-dependent alcohol dehydrogenase